jgi:hypothetical protein
VGGCSPATAEGRLSGNDEVLSVQGIETARNCLMADKYSSSLGCRHQDAAKLGVLRGRERLKHCAAVHPAS